MIMCIIVDGMSMPFNYFNKTSAWIFLNVSKLVVFISAATYFSGLMISNIFLASHGFYLFQLVKADYMLVGGLWISLLFLTYSWLGLIIEYVAEFYKRKKWKDDLSSIFLLLAGFLFIMGIVSTFAGDVTTELNFHHLLFTSGVFLIQGLSLHIIIFVFLAWNSEENEKRGGFGILCVGTLVFLTIFLSSYYTYAIHIYPLYPRIIGGGHSAQAQLIFKKEALASMKNIGLDINENGHSREVKILYETSNAYFILFNHLKTKRALKVSSSNIEAVLYKPPSQKIK